MNNKTMNDITVFEKAEQSWLKPELDRHYGTIKIMAPTKYIDIRRMIISEYSKFNIGRGHGFNCLSVHIGKNGDFPPGQKFLHNQTVSGAAELLILHNRPDAFPRLRKILTN